MGLFSEEKYCTYLPNSIHVKILLINENEKFFFGNGGLGLFDSEYCN